MPKENIDTEQAKITNLEGRAGKEQRTKELQKKLAENHATFGAAVDAVQVDLEQAKTTIHDPTNLSELDGLSGELAQYLARTAAAGEKIYWDEVGSGKADGLETIDSAAKSVNDKISEIRESIPVLKALEYAEYQCLTVAEPWLQKAKKIKETGEIDPALLEGYGGKREAVIGMAEYALTAVVAAKRSLKGVTLSSIPPDLSAAFTASLTMVDDSLSEGEKLKQFYETMDYISKEKNKKYFNFDEKNGEVTVTEEFKKLPQEEQDNLLMELRAANQKIKDDVDERCATTDEEQRFFNGKKELAAGDWAFAKSDFVAYVSFMEANPNKLPEDQIRLAESKESLKQIALMELTMARQRLDLMRKSLENRFANVTNPGQLDVGTTYMEAKISMDQMEKVLEMAEKRIETGESMTIEEIDKKFRDLDVDKIDPHYEDEKFALKAWRKNFERNGETHGIFNVLVTQELLSRETDPKKKEAMILALAKEAYAKGFPDLARYYYDLYFAPEIKKKSGEISKSDFTRDLLEKTDFQKQLKGRMDSLKPELEEKLKKDWDYKYYPDGITAARQEELKSQGITFEGELQKMMDTEQEKIQGEMVDQEYLKVVKTAVHKDFEGDLEAYKKLDDRGGAKGARAVAWDDVYGNTFHNLDSYDTHWYQFWKFSDEEWNKFKVTIWLDIATMMATAGTAGVVVDEVMGGVITRALMERGIAAATVREMMSKGTIQFGKFVVSQLGIKKAAAYGIGYMVIDDVAKRPVKKLLGSLVHAVTDISAQTRDFFKQWGGHALRSAQVDATHEGSNISPADMKKIMEGNVVYKI